MLCCSQLNSLPVTETPCDTLTDLRDGVTLSHIVRAVCVPQRSPSSCSSDPRKHVELAAGWALDASSLLQVFDK